VGTEITYFSGTGNSLHVARELQARLPGAGLTPIVSLLHGDGPIRMGAEAVGLVFPNFCLSIPIPVHDFLRRADLSAARYIFAICTRGGSRSEAFEYIDQLLKKQGKKLDARIDINMPWNHPMGEENLPGLNTEERIARLEAAMQDQLDTFSQRVAAREAYRPSSEVDYALSSGMNVFDAVVSKPLNYRLHVIMYRDLVRFYSDETCNGCGLCEKVCTNGKIALVDKRPVWKKDVKCYACFACINFCPRQAIQIESRFPIQSYTTVNGRYHHASVTYKDIARQREG
jgi:ferredoxin